MTRRSLQVALVVALGVGIVSAGAAAGWTVPVIGETTLSDPSASTDTGSGELLADNETTDSETATNTPTSSQPVVADSTGATESSSSGLEAELEDGTLVLSNKDDSDYRYRIEYGNQTLTSRIAGNSTEAVPGFAPGEFIVRAESMDGEPVSVNGDETFEFTVDPKGPESATHIEPGEMVGRDGSERGVADDWYALDADAGQTIEIVHWSGQGVNVTLYTARGTRLASGTAYPDASAIGATVTENGTYFLNVRGFGLPDSPYGAVATVVGPDQFEPNDDRANATKLEPGERVSGIVSQRETDWFALEADAGQRITATLSRENVSVDLGNDLEVAIVAPNGSEIGAHDAEYCPGSGVATTRTATSPGCTYRQTVNQTAVAPDDGTYYLRVSGFQYETESFADYSVQGFSNYSLVSERSSVSSRDSR